MAWAFEPRISNLNDDTDLDREKWHNYLMLCIGPCESSFLGCSVKHMKTEHWSALLTHVWRSCLEWPQHNTSQISKELWKTRNARSPTERCARTASYWKSEIVSACLCLCTCEGVCAQCDVSRAACFSCLISGHLAKSAGMSMSPINQSNRSWNHHYHLCWKRHIDTHEKCGKWQQYNIPSIVGFLNCVLRALLIHQAAA